jgi:hypothetical protein
VSLRFRKSLRFGPIRLNLSKRGVSTSVTAGPVSVSRRGTSVNLPGPFSWFSGRKS